jgi:hypothetical protein
MKWIRTPYMYVTLALLGLAGGFVYWQFWGCTDSCPIDSSWKLSMLRGGLIGLCLAAILQPTKSKETQEKEAAL